MILTQTKGEKDKGTVENPMTNVLEDEENESITGIVPNAEPEPAEGGVQVRAKTTSSQGAATQNKRKRGTQLRKRRKLIPDDEEIHS